VSFAIIAYDFRQQPIKLINGPIPECLVPRDPAARLLQWPLTQPKPVYAPFDRAFNEPSLFQHSEVIRNSGLCRTELSAKLAGAASLASRQGVNHRATGAVRQGAKGTIQVFDMLHSYMTICFSARERKAHRWRDQYVWRLPKKY
jgi:hypothetical protein